MANSIRIPNGLKHSIWSVLDAVVYPLVYTAALPFLIKGIGVTAFGFWVVLNTIIITLQLFNLNIGLTTVRYVSVSIAKGDTMETNKLMNALLQICFMLLLLVTMIGIGMAYIFPRYDILKLNNAPVSSVSICLLLTAIISALKFFDLVFNSFLKASEKFKTASILSTVSKMGLLSINVLLAVNHYSVLHLLWGNIIYAVLYLFVQVIIIQKAFPFFSFSLVREISLYKQLLQFSMYPWLQFLITLIAFQTDRFWVSSYAGLREVSAYGLTATIFNHIHMIFMAMASWMLPRIAAMTAKGDNPAKLYYSVRGLLLSFASCGLLFFYFAYPFVFRFWLGKELYGNMNTYVTAFIAFEIVFVHTIMPFFYLNAAGKERVATFTTLLYSAVCYLLMISGLYFFKNPVYMIYGMTIALCITIPIINTVVRKRIRLPQDKNSRFNRVEMLPFYIAITALFVPYQWMYFSLLIIVLVLLYRFYLVDFFNRNLCKQP